MPTDPNKATIWKYDSEEILLPNSRIYADYNQSICKIIKTIAEIEKRSELEILSDILHSGFDIIRIRDISEDAKDGTLNFEHSILFINQVREMVLSAACSASSKKLTYRGPKPHNAEEFMRTIRFGQTERGSFILQILSPVRPLLREQGTLLDLTEEEDYDRRVIPTLKSGLQALNNAARLTSIDKDLVHFKESVDKGLTTNLCDAVVTLYKELNPKSLEVNIQYSVNRSIRHSDSNIIIDRDYIPIIDEVSSALKINEPVENTPQLVRGPIINMHSENPAIGGEIVIRDLMSRIPKAVSLNLDSEDYIKAIEAHKKNFFLETDGILIQPSRGVRARLECNTLLKFFDPLIAFP